MTTKLKLILAAGISTLALGTASTAAAQETPETETIQSANDIVVQGEIGFRNRSEETVPTLVYDTDYFQRFEPLTAGDALKRVPSVTFLSDVIESDGARLRGLDPGYTQILINGDKVPGSNVDRSFFLDRIPAELISRVEIVRSSSARRTGDAMAGTLNIVLRDGYQLDGGYVRVGGLHFDDGEIKPSFGAVFGGPVGPGRLLIGGNIQGRYNPKIKQSLRYSDSPENNPNYATQDFDNREDQTDTRDGEDYAFNASYTINTDTTDISLSGFYVRTDRTETERSYEYNHPTAINGSIRGVPPGNLTVDNSNINEIDQENYTIAGKVKQDWSAGQTTLKVGYSRFWDHSDESEVEIEFDRASPRVTGDMTYTRTVSEEFSVSLDHEVDLGQGLDLVFGGFYQDKDYDTKVSEATRQRFNLGVADHSWNQFFRTPDTLVAPFNAGTVVGASQVEEVRTDGFVLIEGKSGAIAWEAGLRYENTRVAIGGVKTADYGMLLPSVSVKFELSPANRITLSGARTNRRPRLDFLTPITLEAELGDNDLQGNPNLRPESSWGADLGFEHRIGKTGVVGVNFFYRDVTDLIEIANTGVPGSEDSPADRAWVYQPRNTGSGQVYGVEFDLSTNLGFLGLRETGVFGNFSLLESNIGDEIGERRFNGQSRYVFNVGMIQNIPSIGGAFGVTYRKQGKAFDRNVGEEITTTYGADLEVFVEKRFGDSFTIRAVGSNLLDGHKDELFNKFTTIGDQQARNFDEYEVESERAGPVFQIIGRFAF